MICMIFKEMIFKVRPGTELKINTKREMSEVGPLHSSVFRGF